MRPQQKEVSIRLPLALARRLAQEFAGFVETDETRILEGCSPTALALFRLLATQADALETEQVASALRISKRSLPPVIMAAKRALSENGESLDDFIVRERHFRHAKPYTSYKLTERGKRVVVRCLN